MFDKIIYLCIFNYRNLIKKVIYDRFTTQVQQNSQKIKK